MPSFLELLLGCTYNPLGNIFPFFSDRDYFGINRASILLGDWSLVITVILKWPIFARGRQPGFSGHIPVASMATVSQLAKSNQIPQHSAYAFHELDPMQALSPNSAKSKSDSFMRDSFNYPSKQTVCQQIKLGQGQDRLRRKTTVICSGSAIIL